MRNGAAGFSLSCDQTRLVRNRALANAAEGIRNSATESHNDFVENVALANATLDLFQLAPGCGNNDWRRNTFGSSNQACID